MSDVVLIKPLPITHPDYRCAIELAMTGHTAYDPGYGCKRIQIKRVSGQVHSGRYAATVNTTRAQDIVRTARRMG